jgi:hypothetical protein
VRETHPEERPGPGYYESRSGALTERSARIPTAPISRQWLREVAECAKDVSTPGPVHYNADDSGLSTFGKHVPSATMMSPRSNSLQHGDFTVHDLRREESPGPGSYEANASSLSMQSPRIGKTRRVTGEYMTSQGSCSLGVSTPSPVHYNPEPGNKLTMKHSSSASARMLSPRFNGIARGQLTVHDLEDHSARPGPGAYATPRGAFRAGSARFSTASRDTEALFLHTCAPGLLTPSSARYRTEDAITRRMSTPNVSRVPSSSMTAGRDSCFLRGDVVVHDLVRSSTPGPGHYELARGSGALTERGARITREVRRTESWAHYECAKGVNTPGPQDYVGPEEYAQPNRVERSSSHDLSHLSAPKRSPRSSLRGSSRASDLDHMDRRARDGAGDESVRSFPETATTQLMSNGYTPQSQARDDLLTGTPRSAGRSSATPTPVRYSSYQNPTASSEIRRQTAVQKMHPRA